ncbi:ankyrin repeat-containing domain protein [Hyaloscypha finlandica]|nr:ankyrin repeat-containing domain protein [Hyaloscypha finlandica]
MGSQRETYQEVLPNEELNDPPPPYTDEKDEWGLKSFEEQDFYFDTSKLSKAFITAIESEDYVHVKLLLQNGESPLAVNEDKWCALHYAVRVDSKRIMRALLAAKQVQGVIRAIDQSDKNGNTALHFAAYLGKKNMVRELLDKNADANAKNRHQQSPLFKAAEGNHEQIVEILLARKAIFLPLEPTPGCLVLKRFNELRIAINHRKVQARKIEARKGKV